MSLSCDQTAGPPQNAPSGSSPASDGQPPAASAELDAFSREEIEVAERLMRAFPRTPEPLAVMATALARQGRSVEAARHWEACLQIDPRSAAAHGGLALIALQQGDYDTAVKRCRQAIEIDSALPGLHDRLGRALLCLGDIEGALTALAREVALTPRSSEARVLLGQAHFQHREYDKAIASYQAALRLQPDAAAACYGLASTYARLHDGERAREFRERFRKLKANELRKRAGRLRAFDDLTTVRHGVARTLTEAGRVYLRHRQNAEAERCWRRAAAVDPESAACRLDLMRLYQLGNRDEEALRIAEELRKIQPHDATHCLNVGVLNAGLGRFERAETAFQTAIKLAPRRAAGYAELAELYLSNGRHLSQARALAESAVRLEPTAAQHYVLSWASQANGDRTAALAAMEEALKQDPTNEKYRRMYEQLQRP